MNTSGTDDATREVNMTPLIDVSLVLVVMLLLMTPLALETSLAIKSAQASGRQGAADDDERVELHVADAKDVRVNERTVPRASLGSELAPLLTGPGAAATVVVSCAADVPHGVFVEVIDTAKLAGAAEIALIAR